MLKLPGTPARRLSKDHVAQGSGRGQCPEADLGQLAEQGPLPEDNGAAGGRGSRLARVVLPWSTCPGLGSGPGNLGSSGSSSICFLRRIQPLSWGLAVALGAGQGWGPASGAGGEAPRELETLSASVAGPAVGGSSRRPASGVPEPGLKGEGAGEQ